MEESGIENTPTKPVREIVKRKKGGGVVPTTSPSRSLRITSRAIAAVTAAGILVGGAKLIDDATSVEAANDQVHTTQVQKVPELTTSETQTNEPTHFDQIFHDLNPAQKAEARAQVDEFRARILAKPGYEKQHLEIPLKYKEIIEQSAHAYGISVDTLMGLIGTENGGGVDITNSESKARGVAQFMPETAGDYRLKIGNGIDQRADPVLSIDAAGRYLRNTKALFGGDEGMALWSFHAGPGNVFTALEIYFLDVDHEDIGNYGDAIGKDDEKTRLHVEEEVNKRIANHKLDVFKLLSNSKVMEFTAKLRDYSETYPTTVVAVSQIIREQDPQVHDLGDGVKITLAQNPHSSPLGR